MFKKAKGWGILLLSLAPYLRRGGFAILAEGVGK